MDWAELDPDVLRIIAKKVGDISNFIRLRAICKQWRLALHPSDQPPQLPCFIQCERNADSSSYSFQFFSLYSNRTHTLPIRNARLAVLRGSSCGYISVSKKKEFMTYTTTSLQNPITGSEVSFPFGLFSYPIFIGSRSNSTCHPTKNKLDVLIVNEIISDPSRKFSLWHYEDGRWTKINEVPYQYFEGIYYNGKIFIFPRRPARVIDVQTGIVMPSLPDQYAHFRYLIDAGDYLLGLKPVNMSKPNYSIEVFQLEHAGKDSCWIKVNGDIGDRILILDFHYGFCLNASDFDGFKGNCIYFNGYYYTQDNQRQRGIIRYDMETSQKQLLLSLENSSGAWFVPSLC